MGQIFTERHDVPENREAPNVLLISNTNTAQY
jgi:hypothetical protein